MVQHGGIPRAHVYSMLASQDASLRRAAFILLEASNPSLRKSSELFIEIVRFIWDANPSYDVYREFSRRHFFAFNRTVNKTQSHYIDVRAQDRADF